MFRMSTIKDNCTLPYTIKRLLLLTIKVNLIITILLFSTMTCFKWSTKMCLNTEGADEICKLSPKPKLNMAIMPKDEEQSRTFFSPGIHRNRNYNRIFCIYNVTLKCPGRQAILSAKERTLPFGENCGDYLAIYTDPSNPIPKEKVCGNEIDPNFKMTLNSNTFLAILWTNRKTSSGKFEIEAKCGDMIQDHDEGSGDMLINTTVTTYKD